MTVTDLRAEAHRIAGVRRDVIRAMSPQVRRDELLAYADRVIDEEGWPDERGKITPLLDAIVPLLTDPHENVMARFDALVEAVRERRDFDADPADYADLHDWPTTSTALLNLSDRLCADVEFALDALVGTAS